ncbi:MAG: hypothetical protein AAFN78_01580 [Pseudomonadota bacterium]
MIRNASVLLAALLVTGIAHADPGSGQGEDSGNREGERRGPPRVAVEACASAVQGDACSFEGRRGESLQGTCWAPQDKPLACKPEGAPPPRDSGAQGGGQGGGESDDRAGGYNGA